METDEKKLITDDDYKKWFREWSKLMTTIWSDRLRKLKISPFNPERDQESWRPPAGDLSKSFIWEGTFFGSKGIGNVQALHTFITYGIFVDLGTGKEFGGPRNEKGQLVKPTRRKPKKWFTKSYYRSVMVAKEFSMQAIGDQFAAMMFQSAREIAKKYRQK